MKWPCWFAISLWGVGVRFFVPDLEPFLFVHEFDLCSNLQNELLLFVKQIFNQVEAQWSTLSHSANLILSILLWQSFGFWGLAVAARASRGEVAARHHMLQGCQWMAIYFLQPKRKCKLVKNTIFVVWPQSTAQKLGKISNCSIIF